MDKRTVGIRAMVEEYKGRKPGHNDHQERDRTITVVLELDSFGKRWQMWQKVDTLASILRGAGIRFRMYSRIELEDAGPGGVRADDLTELLPTPDFRGAYREV